MDRRTTRVANRSLQPLLSCSVVVLLCLCYAPASFVHAQCALSIQQPVGASSLVFASGIDWTGGDIGTASGSYTASSCFAYCNANYATATIWEVYAGTSCLCKSTVAAGGSDGNAQAGPTTAGVTLADVPSGVYAGVDCPSGYAVVTNSYQCSGTAFINGAATCSAICNPTCLNGYCSTPNVCSCNAGWTGQRCQTGGPYDGFVWRSTLNGGAGVDTTIQLTGGADETVTGIQSAFGPTGYEMLISGMCDSSSMQMVGTTWVGGAGTAATTGTINPNGINYARNFVSYVTEVSVGVYKTSWILMGVTESIQLDVLNGPNQPAYGCIPNIASDPMSGMAYMLNYYLYGGSFSTFNTYTVAGLVSTQSVSKDIRNFQNDLYMVQINPTTGKVTWQARIAGAGSADYAWGLEWIPGNASNPLKFGYLQATATAMPGSYKIDTHPWFIPPKTGTLNLVTASGNPTDPASAVVFNLNDYCVLNAPCVNGGTCVNTAGGYACHCMAGYAGTNCQTDINECASRPCANGGVCTDFINGFTCACQPGWSGPVCANNINECGSTPCRNGGICTDLVNGFTCACAGGFSGSFCQTDVNECASAPCKNGGSCVDAVASFVCKCPPGRSGVLCQTDINECASNPCLFGGTCSDQLNSFACACVGGYSGLTCQTDVNECVSNPCTANGACFDFVNSWTCVCDPGFSGNICQTNVNECASLPCANGGTCIDDENQFECVCVPGYSGIRCQTDINECSSAPCANGGTCIDQLNAFTCTCAAGYSGAQCLTDVNECASSPCEHLGSTCVDQVNSFKCMCVAGYSGKVCQTDINECASQPCRNGGTCFDATNKFTCACAPGYSGLQCQTNVNECASGPCRNGGVCADLINGYACTCQPGFSGLQCQTNVNECASTPCQHSGGCIDVVNGYNCACVAGWGGANCQTQLFTCSSLPCMNGAVCQEFNSYYTCACQPGFSGVLCQTNINECASAPCLLGAGCNDLVNGFSCGCPAGYTGSVCQTNINECASNPCGNGGTCTDLIAGYTCACVAGFSGAFCQTDVNECVSAPCRNGGTCTDRINAFTCTCASGFSGTLCQTDINECASTPCRFGTCVDAINQFRCVCASGYSGTVCQTEINECASGPCKNGGTCADRVNGFTCTCAAGFTGLTCQTDINECASQPCVHGGCLDRTNAYFCLCSAGFAGPQCTLDINECATDNGGCGLSPLSTCTNSFGGFNCTAYITPGSVTVPDDSFLNDNPLVLGSLNAQPIIMFVTAVGFDYHTLSITLGSASAPREVACTGFASLNPLNQVDQACECQIPHGAGVYRLFLWQQFPLPGGTFTVPKLLWASNDTVSYPPPIIFPGTLRQNRTNYDATPSAFVALDTTNSVLMMFDGNYFEPNETDASVMAVTYGPHANPALYACAIDIDLSSETTVACWTEAGSQGSNLIFQVIVGGLVAIGNDSIAFPLTPYVHRVSGCVDDGNSTTLCGTEGGQILTVYGANFFQSGIGVTVGGGTCNQVTVSPDGTFCTCLSPIGAGGAVRAVVVVSLGQPSQPGFFVTYAVATSSNVYGCTPTANPLAIADCPTIGNSIITVVGINFGLDGAVVLVGSSLCLDVQHDAVHPHRQLTCRTPSGVGIDRPILILQSGGGIGPSSATLGYHQCPTGTYVTGLTCTDCPNGTFTGVLNAQACGLCPAGTYTGALTAASACLPCPPGSFSIGGVTNCSACAVGSANSASQQASCGLCAAGMYSDTRGAHVCVACEVGSYQPSVAAASCLPCPDGFTTVSAGQAQCRACDPGSVRSANDSTCTPCAAGSCQVAPGQVACTPCAPGSFSIAGAAACGLCTSGTMAPRAGSLRCTVCPDGSKSNAQFTICECSAGAYATTHDVDMQCETCTRGAKCDRPALTYSEIIAEDGWWRPDNYSLTFYSCLQPGQCVNGGCANNRVGPLCAVCAPGYSSNGQGQDCTPCPSHGASIGSTIGFTLLIIIAVGVVFYIVWRSEPAKVKHGSPYLTVKAWGPEDRTPPNYVYNFKILLSYLQIATTLLSLAELPFPTAFKSFVSAFAFVNLSFIPWGSVECVADLDYYNKLVLIFIVPIAVIVLLTIIPLIVTWCQNRFDYNDDKATRDARKDNRRKIVKLIVFALFLMYPAISQSVLSFFICRDVNGESYLVADFNLHCGDAKWRQNLPLAVVSVVLYPIGIPCFIFVSLFRLRKRMRHPHVITSWGIVFEAFKSELWWFELVDMLSKLFLTSMIGFFDASIQLAVGMLICGLYLLILLIAHPFIRHIDDRMSLVVQVHLFLICCIGYVLQHVTFVVGSLEDVFASVLMFIVLIALVALMTVHGVIFVRKYVRNVQRAKAKRNEEHLESNPLAKPDADANGSGTGNSDERDAATTTRSERDSHRSGTGTGTGTGRCTPAPVSHTPGASMGGGGSMDMQNNASIDFAFINSRNVRGLSGVNGRSDTGVSIAAAAIEMQPHVVSASTADAESDFDAHVISPPPPAPAVVPPAPHTAIDVDELPLPPPEADASANASSHAPTAASAEPAAGAVVDPEDEDGPPPPAPMPSADGDDDAADI